MHWQTGPAGYEAIFDGANPEGINLTANPNQMGQGVQFATGVEPIIRAFTVPNLYEEKVEQTYVRGSDIYATFEKDQSDVECYWRLMGIVGESILLESIVSLRSSKQRHHPMSFSLQAKNLQASEGIQESGLEGYRAAVGGKKYSWFLLPHPSDDFDINIERIEAGLEIKMNVPWLERGVIRRIRTLLSFKAGSHDARELESIREHFAQSNIPLTA